MKHLSFFLCLSVALCACESSTKTQAVEVLDTHEVKLAERFQVKSAEGGKIITLDQPWQGSSKGLKYYLYTDHIPSAIQQDESLIKVKVPVQSIISNSTTHLAMLEKLDATDHLIGFAQTQYIYSPEILRRIDAGLVTEVGPDGSLDVELILNLNPDIVLAFSARGENRQLNKLEELGVKVVLNADYLETSMLGRYEWIKFFGHLTGHSQHANQLFRQMELTYDSLTNLVIDVASPTVFSGTLYGGTWYLPDGQNYGSKVLASAGGDYLWKEGKETGWLNLDFEVVYERAWDADFWIGVANFKTLDELLESDERYGDFEAFKNGNVYTYMNRVNEKGGNDYFESGNVHPDRLLADHIKIMHSELLPNYELYYYLKLE